MSDSKRIIPIRPGVGLASSREKPDDDIDDFDESTVVDKGQFAHSLFDGLDDDLDDANLPGPPAHINPVQNMSPRAAVSLPGVSTNQGPQTRPQQPVQVSSAPQAPQPSYQTPAPQMPQAAQFEQPGHAPSYQTPAPAMYQTPVPGQMHTPMPAMYQTPVPPMYQTPMPGQMHTPMPGMYHTPVPGPAAAPASKSNTTVLIIVGAVVLMLAGVGVGSILFMSKDGQPSPTQQASANVAQPGEQNAQVAEPTPPIAAVKTPVVETPATNPAVAETPVTDPVVPVADPVVPETPVAPVEVVAEVAEVPEPVEPVENETKKPSAKPALAVKAPISGEVTEVFLKKAGSVRKGARLFVISELGGVSDAKKKELSDAVSEAEKMVKEDPDLYGPFLVKAKRALANATKTKTVTVNAKRAGSAVPSVKAGDKVKRGQTLAKIN